MASVPKTSFCTDRASERCQRWTWPQGKQTNVNKFVLCYVLLVVHRYEVGAVVLHSALMSGMRVAFPQVRKIEYLNQSVLPILHE